MSATTALTVYHGYNAARSGDVQNEAIAAAKTAAAVGVIALIRRFMLAQTTREAMEKSKLNLYLDKDATGGLGLTLLECATLFAITGKLNFYWGDLSQYGIGF